jgi:hypothetical protein
MSDQDQEVEPFTIRDVIIDIVGITPYSPSRHPGEEKEKSEDWEDYESRIWRRKCHAEMDGDDGDVYVPGAAFKLCLDETVQNLNEKIPGKGNQTYTGVLKMGVAPISNMPLGVRVSSLKVEKVYCHSAGKRGPGTRVMRWFPIVHDWKGTITMRIFNDSLTEKKFEEFFMKAGVLAGVGRGRPSTGCPVGNGRFRPTRFTWSTVG